MRIDWSTLALQLVNFAILIWLLQRFLYRPVLRMIDARKAAIDAARAEAETIERSMQTQRAALDAERAAIAAERSAALESTATQAEAAARARRAEAEREAGELMEATRRTLAEERDRALDEARRAAVDLAARAARRLLSELPPPLRGAAWLDRIGQHLESLPQSERAALASELRSGETLRVTTATPLTPTEVEGWRERLRAALGPEVSIAFAANPDLIAGAELGFPHTTLRFGLRSVLDALDEESRPHGVPR